MVLLTTLLEKTAIDGTLSCDCPHGQLELRANSDARSLHLDFSNARSFRYFLSSIPGFSITHTGRYQQLATSANLSLILSIDGLPLLKKSSGDDKLDIDYWKAGKQWLLWKLGL